MKYKFTNIILSILIVPCLFYYMGKFYLYKQLVFDSTYLIGGTILSILVICGLLLNGIILHNLKSLHRDNQELHKIITYLSSSVESNPFEDLQYQQNTREIILDREEQ